MTIKTTIGSLVVLAGLLQIGANGGNEQIPASLKSSQDLAVVINPKNDTNDLSSAELRQILLGERKFWKNKAPLTIVLREPGSREREEVIATLGMSDAEFGQHWRDRVFRGEAAAVPLAVPSNGMASQVVRDNAGGVTFVLAKNLSLDLKVLKIDGKLPGDAGYPLK
jgi:ABC-type phosphate transport system substrate-binding protein